MNTLWFLFIGLIAGWLAGMLTGHGGYGIIGDIIVGVVGSMLGGLLFNALGISAYGTVGSVIMAVIGAIVFIGIMRTLVRV